MKPYTYFEYNLEKETGVFSPEGSFCRTFMEAVDEACRTYGFGKFTPDTGISHSLHDAVKDLTGIGGEYNYLKRNCETVNDSHSKIRRAVNKKMVDFLLSNDGVIDRWPEPESYHYMIVDSDDNKENRYFFNYFGAPYVPSGNAIKRSTSEPHYYQDYYYSDGGELKEYRESTAWRRNYVSELKAERGLWGKIKFLFALSPVILALILIVPCLISFFFFEKDPYLFEDTVRNALAATGSEFLNGVGGFFGVIMLFVDLIFLLVEWSNAAFFIGLLILALFAAGAVYYLMDCFDIDIRHVSSSELRNEKRTLREMEAELKEMEKAYEKSKKNWQDICSQWNGGFYRYLKKSIIR